MTETKTPPGLPPELQKELAEAGTAAGAAKNEYEDLIRGHTPPVDIFDKIFWLMVEGVEVKRSDAVNNLFRQIAEKVKPGSRSKAYGNAYEIIREFYITGATDADRRRVAKALGGIYIFQREKRHHGENGTGEIEIKTAEELYRQYNEERRWLEENRPAIQTAAKNLRERRTALEAVETKAREYLRANGLSKVLEKTLEEHDALRKRLERNLKKAYKVEEDLTRSDRELERLDRETKTADEVKTGEESEPKPAAPGENKKIGGASKPKAQGRFTREVEKVEKNPKPPRKTIPRFLWEER
ncbi:MAG: hypothetical protein K6E55_06790 [Thermoguttaceae bacterium]|nr:hypothetical protein [Thermoguttaceae bacterium]